MSRITTEQVTFLRGFLEAEPGGMRDDGVAVLIAVNDRITHLSLTTEQAEEAAALLTEAVARSRAIRIAKDAEFNRVEAEALADGADEEEAANIAGDAAEKVTLP